MKNQLFLLCFFLSFCLSVFSQTDTIVSDTTRKNNINIFLDCGFCDLDYIKQEIPYVNYVRDQSEANVYIIITQQSTGSGGTEYTVMFAGLTDFEFMNDMFKYSCKPNATENEIRVGITNTIKLGLMRYVLKTSMADQVTVNYSKPEEKNETAGKDPWRNWVFGLNLYGYMSGQETYKYLYADASVSIRRVTEKYKFLFDASTSYRESNFTIGDEIITSMFRSNYLSNTYVRSLGSHWSAGYSANLNTSSYSNLELKYLVFPAIEYNLFPYSESTSKQLRFMYGIGYVQSYYIDTTIFNKIQEGLFAQSMDVSLKIIKNWGSVTTSVNGFCYLHDFSKNSLNLYTQLSIRIIKGLSFSLSGNVAVIHDQLSLPRASASSEDILLQQRQLATQYSYWINIGIGYTFGSIYNNVVNPRFGD